MAEVKVVLSTQDGKSYQAELKDAAGEYLHGKKIGDTIPGEGMGYPGYEFLVTGGSDKCGFPMRKGILLARKQIVLQGGVGFSGKNRKKKRQSGLFVKKTVCGERITHIIHQVNMKVLKEGSEPLVHTPVEKKTGK